MYSTKHLENILLAELTRKQYRQFMDDVADSSGLYFKQIRNVRNSDTFKKVFGNKQRIWIPLDIEVEYSTVDVKQKYERLFGKYYLYSNNDSIIDILYNIYPLLEIWDELTNKQEIDVSEIYKYDMLLYWIKGYIRVNNRIFKIGTLINRLMGIAKKVYVNNSDKLQEIAAKLSSILSNFKNRKAQIDK